MRLPEVQARLYELAKELKCEELRTLADQISRRQPVMRGPAISRRVTTDIADTILELRRDYPSLTQLQIGNAVNVNPGRVSEVLAGKRR